MRNILMIAATVMLAACVTAVGTPYGPADEKGFGYQETKLEADRFRISFSGDGATPVDVVEEYALLRAAELTLENGYDWFRVIGRSIDGDERGGVDVGAGFGSGNYGRRRGVSVGVGGNLGRVGARQFFTARLEILMGKGAQPDDSSEIYDAQSIVDSITPLTPDAP